MITERTLKQWRRDALKTEEPGADILDIHTYRQRCVEMKARILRLTQELLDQHLLRKR